MNKLLSAKYFELGGCLVYFSWSPLAEGCQNAVKSGGMWTGASSSIAGDAQEDGAHFASNQSGSAIFRFAMCYEIARLGALLLARSKGPEGAVAVGRGDQRAELSFVLLFGCYSFLRPAS